MACRKYIQWYISCLSAITNDWLRRFLDHTQRRTTVSRTPLDEWSAHRRDLYLTTHSTHNRQTSMPPVGFEPTTPVGERPQTYALDRVATGTDLLTPETVLAWDSVTEIWPTISNSWAKLSTFGGIPTKLKKKIQARNFGIFLTLGFVTDNFRKKITFLPFTPFPYFILCSFSHLCDRHFPTLPYTLCTTCSWQNISFFVNIF